MFVSWLVIMIINIIEYHRRRRAYMIGFTEMKDSTTHT